MSDACFWLTRFSSPLRAKKHLRDNLGEMIKIPLELMMSCVAFMEFLNEEKQASAMTIWIEKAGVCHYINFMSTGVPFTGAIVGYNLCDTDEAKECLEISSASMEEACWLSMLHGKVEETFFFGFLIRDCWQRGEVPGLFLGLLGVLTIVSRHGAWSGGSALGVVLQIAGVICKASAATLAQYYNWRPEVKASVMLQALVQATFGALVATILSLALDFRGLTPSFLDPRHLSKGGGWEFLADVGGEQWLCLLGLGLFGSCVVYMLQFLLLRRVGAVRQTLMDQFALIIGVLEGAILLGEWCCCTARDSLATTTTSPWSRWFRPIASFSSARLGEHRLQPCHRELEREGACRSSPRSSSQRCTR
ncbi:unnamed protein product [Symbiodinium sp. CCMP2592]|nr:unnamed protein product [Symbiodinium sp. CCMP2592]